MTRYISLDELDYNIQDQWLSKQFLIVTCVRCIKYHMRKLRCYSAMLSLQKH